MILARLSKAIREQSWFAFVLEFVIVIAGVVIRQLRLPKAAITLNA